MVQGMLAMWLWSSCSIRDIYFGGHRCSSDMPFVGHHMESLLYGDRFQVGIKSQSYIASQTRTILTKRGRNE